MANKENLLNDLNEVATRLYSESIVSITEKQLYSVVCTYLRELLAKKRKAFKEEVNRKSKKQVYYMSMEFLVGTSLRNNLFNLGIEEDMRLLLKEEGFDIERLYELDPDAGLGNGGLGRLASCYLDSLTGLDMPAVGYSIRYEFGIFKQKIVDGWQMEFPDNWLERGEVWLQPRYDESYEIKFGGSVDEWYDNGRFRVSHKDYNSVIAVPYDMYISGYDCKAVNKLILWSATAPGFDMGAFSRGDYVRSLEHNTMAEVISKVLYPADDHIEGKRLRLRQQYLLVSASLQSILSKHIKKYRTLDNLPDKVAIHINDTHPALCVPELMRLLMDEHDYGWDAAWEICAKTLSYTNHTVMSEALERWYEWLFKEQLPRLYAIVVEINRRLVEGLYEKYPGDKAKIDYMAVIANGEVRMANLCLACSHKINGVSKLHTEILKDSIFHDYYNLDNSRFCNVTNGIAYRRWLCQSNPLLTDYIKGLIGDGFMKNATDLEKLLKYKDDAGVICDLSDIKHKNKLALAKYISEKNGIIVDGNSIFDVQIKRLHEYKRQLLNVLHILYLYNRIKNNPSEDITPRTFIFAAKASAGYYMAKRIISLIMATSELVNRDPVVHSKIKVVFLEDYKVSLAERIIPAADISEQISIAGKEASGTGNMKLMINGAVTLGTLDGANVEITEQVGEDNIFLFGMKVEDVEALWKKGYNPMDFVNSDAELKAVLDMMKNQTLGNFEDIYKNLTEADPYMCLAEFRAYVEAQQRVNLTYKDERKFGSMSLINIAKAGFFSADRSVKEYADNIWYLK